MRTCPRSLAVKACVRKVQRKHAGGQVGRRFAEYTYLQRQTHIQRLPSRKYVRIANWSVSVSVSVSLSASVSASVSVCCVGVRVYPLLEPLELSRSEINTQCAVELQCSGCCLCRMCK